MALHLTRSLAGSSARVRHLWRGEASEARGERDASGRQERAREPQAASRKTHSCARAGFPPRARGAGGCDAQRPAHPSPSRAPCIDCLLAHTVMTSSTTSVLGERRKVR